MFYNIWDDGKFKVWLEIPPRTLWGLIHAITEWVSSIPTGCVDLCTTSLCHLVALTAVQSTDCTIWYLVFRGYMQVFDLLYLFAATHP